MADQENVVGPAARQIGPIGIDKGYDNQLVFTFEIDEAAVVDHVVSSYDLDRDDQRAVQGARSLEQLYQTLSTMEPRPDRLHQMMVALVSNYGSGSAHLAVARRLQKRLPKFANFSEYMRMPGQIAVNDLRSRLQSDNLEEADRVFLALLATIGRSVDDLEQIDQHEMLTAELEAASNRITQQVF